LPASARIGEIRTIEQIARPDAEIVAELDRDALASMRMMDMRRSVWSAKGFSTTKSATKNI
jgi:hypothetical protein